MIANFGTYILRFINWDNSFYHSYPPKPESVLIRHWYFYDIASSACVSQALNITFTKGLPVEDRIKVGINYINY